MDKPGGECASKHQMIDCYIHTLAKVLGSEEEAKKKIYNVSCERYFRFGCEIDEDTSNKLEGIPSVLFVLPDSHVDPEHKDYGADVAGVYVGMDYGVGRVRGHYNWVIILHMEFSPFLALWKAAHVNLFPSCSELTYWMPIAVCEP